MKKKYYISFLLSITLTGACLATDVTSQTFIFPRPLFNNLAAQNGPWLVFASETMNTLGASLQIIGAHQESLKQKGGEGYFSINCKKDLLFAGDETSIHDQRDVRAEYFNLPDDFIGTVQICPQQEQSGFWITYFQRLGKLIDHSFFHHLAFITRVPFVSVKNSLNLQQLSAINTSSSPPENIIEALDQPGLAFAKMFSGEKKDQGIAEIRFDLRTTFIDQFPFLLAAYSGFIIPTFRRVNPEFIFDPLVGINRHPAIVAGANFQFPLSNEDCPWLFAFFFDAENRFYIRTTQCRTFDLRTLNPVCKRKQWSRYLPVRKEGQTETIFAANILTFPVIVKPDNRANLDGGFRWYYGPLQVEAGYQLWVHGNEKIDFKPLDCEGRLFPFEEFGIAGTGTNSASNSTINMLAPDDPEFITIKANDIDLLSGAARGVSTNMIYASLGLSNAGPQAKIPCMIDFGAFYEVPKNNAAFTNWGIWGKIAIQY